MARKLRIEFPGAFYHVIARGNNKQDIFHDNKDKKYFLEKVAYYKKKFEFEIFAYILMPNHFHLLIETFNHPLNKIMQGIILSYTIYFQRKYFYTGHLFQGRYKSILCNKESYLLELIRYIHLNPVRSGIVSEPSLYHWSSHPIYLSNQENNIINPSLVLSMFSPSLKIAIKKYKIFILNKITDGHNENFYNIFDQRFLGNSEFIENVQNSSELQKDVNKASIILNNITEKDIIDKVAKIFSISKEAIEGQNRKNQIVLARKIFCYIGAEYTNLSKTLLSKELKKDPSYVTHSVNNIKDLIMKDKNLAAMIRDIVNQFKFNFQT